MGSEILRPESRDSVPTSSAEVEFALVLSRMIESAKNDPEYLRSAVFELARHKLKEQFGSDPSVNFPELSKSLEVAIQGVEAFKNRAPALPAPGASQQGGMLTGPQADGLVARTPGGVRFAIFWRFVVVVVMGLAVVFAFRQQGVTIEALRNQVGLMSALQTRPASVQQVRQDRAEAVNREPVQPPPLTPTAYGIYAVSQEKLYELELLPGRVPDMRVAVSPAISTPSKTTLPDGHLKFVVYRRDSATNAADRAEVRIIARVAQETTFNPAGKAIAAKVDDTWVIRNVSILFRTAPNKDVPDMYEVQSDDPGTALAPGRYALVIKGQAYDFSVAGEVTDRRQCLERLAATNGQFYSECQKP